MARPSFVVNGAEPFQQQSVEMPPLDMHRAELSREHVRALNTQFASWVQTQLQNHPDELWEDGIQDYITHASNIMEKFSDVVNWLKANAKKGGNFSAMGSYVVQKKLVSESKGNQINPFQEKTAFANTVTSANFGQSWRSGLLNSSQTSSPFLASQTSAPLDNDASNDGDGEEELQQPSSPSVKRTEDKGVIVVHEVKCKLYVKSSDPADKDAWKDKGTGQLSIKCKEGVDKGTKESKPTVIIRNDVGKVLLNALLYPGIKTNMQKNSIVTIFHTAGDSTNEGGSNNGAVARTCLIRTKTVEDRDKLAEAIQDYAPAA
ncbi:hypothetical protein NMG60_11030398 [Bertholletia excelsa]